MNGLNDNENNDVYDSNNCDRIGIGVLWGDIHLSGIMDNDNDVDKNLKKKKKKKKMGVESSKAFSIEEKKRSDMCDLGCDTIYLYIYAYKHMYTYIYAYIYMFIYR
jgi:hypothetical protein